MPENALRFSGAGPAWIVSEIRVLTFVVHDLANEADE
jgi:hypothetical protein